MTAIFFVELRVTSHAPPFFFLTPGFRACYKEGAANSLSAFAETPRGIQYHPAVFPKGQVARENLFEFTG